MTGPSTLGPPTARGPLTAKGAATRQRIVEGAALLVRADGVERTGLDDIRAATATSKSQLFHYFPGGRADLLYAVAQHEAAQVIADQQPQLDQLGAPATWRAWRDVVVAKYREQGRACPLRSLTAQLAESDPRITPLVADLLDDWHRRITDGVRRWSADAAVADLGAGDAGGGDAGGGDAGGGDAGGGDVGGGDVGGGGSGDPAARAATILAAVQGGVVLMLSTGRVGFLEIALDTAILPLEGSTP